MTEMTWRADNIETIANFFSAAECEEYVSWGEAIGFKDAPISTSMGMIMAKDVRDNERVMVDDLDRAQALYQRLSRHLAPSFQHRWQPVGLNERLRIYRYDVGQKFDWHRDGHFERDNGERSQFTFMIYLNDGYAGGETRFESVSVAGKPGMALVFEHEFLHEGAEVTGGVKYVLRSDVMYGPWATRSAVPQSAQLK